ncbi:MAG: hypothetical protein AAF126_14820 [Chloroflexota bacterium]
MVQHITLEPDWGFDIGKTPQFEVRFVEKHEDYIFVLGISHSGIKVGDRFKVLRRFNPQENIQDRIGDDLVHISLRVAEIHAYHNQLNRINADMTAALHLVGDAESLQATLDDLGWTGDGRNHHQWNERVSDNDKLILTH